MEKFDLIIGGGPGGFVAAIYASQHGLNSISGKSRSWRTCLNWGCIPTKALARNAEVLRTVKEAKNYGITLNTAEIKADYSVAQKRSREVSTKLSRGVKSLMKKNKVTVIQGEGSLLSGTRVQVVPG